MKISNLDLNLKVRLFGESINSILFWMFFPFMAIYFVDTFGERIAGMLMMGPPVLGMIANLFGGFAADRFGRKRMMVIALGVQGVLLFVFALSPSPWIEYFAFVGTAIMGSIYHPASMAMVADIVPVEERRPVFALFYTSVNLGVVVGPILGSIFFFAYKKYLLLTSGTLTLILFLIMVKVLRETLPKSAKEATNGVGVLSQLKNYRIIFTDKAFFVYIIGGILVSQVFMQMDLYLGVYLKNYIPDQMMHLGFMELLVTGERLFGWLISLNGLIVVLFTVMISKLIIKWSDEKALIISSVLFGLSFWLMGFTTNVVALLALMGMFTIAELIRTPVIQNFITRIAPEDKRGQYLGASSLQFTIGRSIAPLAVYLSAYFTPIVIFSLIFASSLLSAWMYKYMFVIIRRNEQVQKKASQ